MLYLLYSMNLMTQVSIPVFPSRTNLKVDSIYVTLKPDKKVMSNLASSKVPGPDCILVVVIINCESKLSYIAAEPANMCLNESCFAYGGKVSSLFPLFMSVDRCTAKNYCPLVFFLW